MTDKDTITPEKSRPVHPSFFVAFMYWLKLGFISFGGPAGQISMMHEELVEKRRWISERRFLHALNFCMLLPGPEAQQLSIYIGWLLHRTWGGIIAGTLFLLPSLFILIGLTYVYLVYGDVAWVQGVFAGIKPAVVAIVVFAAWRIGARALKNAVLWTLAVLSFVAIFVFNIPFPYIVLGAGLLGYLGGLFVPNKFQLGSDHGTSEKGYGQAVIDDDTPRLAHTIFSPRKLVTLLGIGAFVWLGSMALIWDSPILSDMGEFFTKAALVTFGGAYAVLPYVYQGGVETYGWLTGTQMIDGLALGETTPGPLIMVVAFVGYVGGWTKEIFGPDMMFIGGAMGATVATVFTFLPSYLFILAGAPLVESTRENIKFTAPLTAITAAVVGVIVNLAVFFASHVLWSKSGSETAFAGDIDWIAVVLSVAAFIALWKFKIDIMKVIGASAVIGLIISLLQT